MIKKILTILFFIFINLYSCIANAYVTEEEAFAVCSAAIGTYDIVACVRNTFTTDGYYTPGLYWSALASNGGYGGDIPFDIPCEYGLDTLTGQCRVPPPDYPCESPKSWILLTDFSWKCVDVTDIPATSGDNSYGVSGTPGNYNPENYLPGMNCDPLIPYECVPISSGNCFWVSKVNSICVNFEIKELYVEEVSKFKIWFIYILMLLGVWFVTRNISYKQNS